MGMKSLAGKKIRRKGSFERRSEYGSSRIPLHKLLTYPNLITLRGARYFKNYIVDKMKQPKQF
eukprot:scaffold3515_cov126-Cylindrotheca_fusiformis.AAC.50